MSRLTVLKRALLIFGSLLFLAWPVWAADPGCPVVTVNPATLPNGTTGLFYNQTITATGGTAPYSFSLSAGALPNGLALSGAGVLSGTPATPGTYNFTIKATDTMNCMGTRAYTVVIICPALLSQASASFDFPGGNGAVNLTTACAWTATSNVAWIVITSGANGSGNGTVSYTVAANPSLTSPRTGSLTIAGKTFYVQQAAPGLIISENFSNGIPPNWTVVDGGTGNGPPGSAWTTTNPCNRMGGLASPFAIIDPTCAGPSTTPDDELRLPEFDATGLGQVVLQFDSRVRYLNGSGETADVDVSINGGMSWTNVMQFSGFDEAATTKKIDITSIIASNPSRVLIRLHYYIPCAICTRPSELSANAFSGHGSSLAPPRSGRSAKSSPLVQESYWEVGRIGLSYVKLTPVAVSRQQGSSVSNSIIANVTAKADVLNTLTVRVNGSTSATVNGVTVSGISRDSAGVVTANVVAACAATTATFMLTATDGAMISTNATLTVTPTANTAPVLSTYPTTTVATNSSTTVPPSAPPSDNGSIVSLTATAPGFTGSLSGNTTTGVITVTNAAPAGTYTVTVTATDNCGASTTKTFSLGVGAQTITVNTTADTVAVDGLCSLREAIQAANTNVAVNECSAGVAGLDNIVFNLGTGTPTINLTSALPALTQAVNLNGNTGGATRIELNGAGAGAGVVGLSVGGANSTIRSLVVNRFSASGIALGGTGGHIIENCYIGTNAAGTTTMANGQDGVRINGIPNNRIGGLTTTARNLISGNSDYGILIFNAGATGNQVQGNFIGTDVTGLLALGNGQDGVRISSAQNNVIGGASAGARNVISGNVDGVFLLGTTTTGNLVQNNFIGLTANGANALANTNDGIQINGASNNTIGGTSANTGNVIFSNSRAGIFVANNFGSTTGNAILGNSISSNQGLGIDLAPGSASGVTANDAGDPDTGPNNLQNFPVLMFVTSAGTITGSFDSTIANSVYPVRLEFFANTNCDASGNGEGEVFLGSTTLAAPGNFTFGITPVAGKPFITATATDNNGNTSEFSACRKVNTIPAITASAPLTRQQGSAAINSQIAAVNDPDQTLNTLVVTATPLTGSGVTINNIVVSPAGNVTANVSALCGATSSTFMLNVADNLSELNIAMLAVIVTTNTAPTLTYAAASVSGAGSTTVNPATGPNDNGSVSTIAVQSQGTYTGTITVNSSGVVSLSNAAPVGAHTITIRVTDNCGTTTDASFTLTVNNTAPSITAGATATRQQGSAGTTATIATVSDAQTPVGSLTVTATTVPAGLSITGITNTAGTITATITAGCTATLGNNTVILTVTDANSGMATANLTVNVTANSVPTLTYANQSVSAGSTLTINPLTGPSDNGSVSTIAVQNSGTYTGTISVNGSGVVSLSGAKPGGVHTITIRATDNCGATTDAPLTLNVTCPIITVNPPTIPNAMAGVAYNQLLTQTGGAGTIIWSVSAGALPAGLNFNSVTGLLTGTPTVFGTFSFTIKATDANGCMGTQAYALLVNPPCGTITVNPATIPNGFVSTAYPLTTFTALGGAGAVTWSVSTGSLPSGLNLNTSTGMLNGTPTSIGSFSFTIKATDTQGCMGTRQYTVITSGSGLQFYPLAHPVRLLDTRLGQLGCDAPGAAIQGGTSRTQTARRTCDGLTIPSNAMAITGNITTVESGGGYLTLYPSDAAQPLVANSNYSSNEVLNNVFTVGLGNADGAFKIFVTSTTNLVIDVTGYYAPPGAANPGGLYFHPLPKPIRLLETRAGETGCTMPGIPLSGNADTPQQARLTCNGVTIPSTAQAIVGNATTVNPGGGYLTLFPANAARPLVASSNFAAGQVMNAPFTVGLSPAGEFKIYPTSPTDLVIDVLGYYSADAVDQNGAGLLFNALPHPVRLLETRAGFGGCAMPSAPLAGGSTRTQPARGLCDGATIAANALGIVGNATVVNSNGGYLTFWPSTAAQPLVATSNFTAGQVFNRHFTVGLGAGDGAFKIFTFFTTDLVIDVSGYFAP